MKSYHLLALAAIVLTVKSQDNVCLSNSCEVIQNYCQNGGKCVFNNTDCSATCACSEWFSGVRCQSLNSTPNPEREKGSNCLLDPCSTRLAHMSCKNGGTCHFDPGTCAFTCTCDEGFTGRQCEIETSSTESDMVTSTRDSFNSRPRFNSCSADYVERSYAERTCYGQECIFGKCQKELVVQAKGQSWGGYSFSCECDYGAQGSWCDHKCCLDCGDHGACTIYEFRNSTPEGLFCDCKPNYDGERCEEFIPEPIRIQLKENTWYLYVVGACAVTFVFLLAMAMIVPYMMWKHRVILILKIVHYFKAYEDDDEREWDAFVSYKADEADEQFVVHTLYPILEKQMGFKLCLHFRDFVPGETIANNIINAVEGSRRTILILTPRYVNSEFTRFEYEKAQQEMVRRKHRVIPLLLEDISHISSTMDVTLKNIIESVTYLEWPQSDTDSAKKMDKFWKRLHLSMPKKKDTVTSPESSSNNLSTVISPISNTSCVNKSIEPGNVLDKGFPENGIQQTKNGIQQTSYTRMNSYELTVCNTINNCMEPTQETEETIYSEITEIDDSLTETIPTLSELEEAALTNNV